MKNLAHNAYITIDKFNKFPREIYIERLKKAHTVEQLATKNEKKK